MYTCLLRATKLASVAHVTKLLEEIKTLFAYAHQPISITAVTRL
jgi:hypothetical protein